MTERMSTVDRTWLLMERPTNAMVVIGLLITSRPLRLPALRQLVLDRFLKFDRFRCIPVVETRGGRWERDAGFNLDDHVLRVALPAPAGKTQLQT